MGNIPRATLTEPERAGFSRWLAGEQGRLLAQYEREKFSRRLARLFGYHIAQVGHYHGEALHAASPIANKITLRLDTDDADGAGHGLSADITALPFAADSIDVLVAPHVLEFTRRPDAALDEFARVLIDGGHLVISGFNPWSAWGLRRLLPARRSAPPWNGRFYSAAKLNGWLSGLGFELLDVDRFLFRPPLRRGDLLQRLLFLETLGRRCWPFFAAAYLLLAKKQRLPLTPVKPWRRRRKLAPAGASADPATMTEAPQTFPRRPPLETRGRRENNAGSAVQQRRQAVRHGR